MAAAMAAKPTVDPELGSVTQLLKSLDRASKNVRTFGHQNSVAKKFFDQFYTELLNHVERYNALTFIVQREVLFSADSPGDEIDVCDLSIQYRDGSTGRFDHVTWLARICVIRNIWRNRIGGAFG